MSVKKIFLLAGIILLVGCNASTTPQYTKPSTENKTDSNVGCNRDVKQCPNGTLVGRVPPTCEFKACDN